MSLPPLSAASSPEQPTPSVMTPTQVVLLLSVLLGIQPITTDLYLASLPAIGRELGASMAQLQLTPTALLLSFGLSQLVWGPISDRVGRRPVILWGLALYSTAAWLSVMSTHIQGLIVCRALQGMAMGAVVMAARAIVRDLYNPQDGARAMSKGLSGLGFFALASPVLGGWLASMGGWSWALSALGSFGVLAWVHVWLQLKETLPPERRIRSGPWVSPRQWLGIVGHRGFQAFALQSSCAYGVLFTYLATSPFVFIQKLGLTGLGYGSLLACSSLSYLSGTFFCRWLLRRLPVHRVAAWGGAITFCGAWLVVLSAMVLTPTWWSLAIPIMLMIFAHGIHQPIGQSASIAPFPHEAGTASALNGFAMMLAAFVMGQWLGHRFDGSIEPLVHGLAFWGSALALTCWTGVQRHGRF
jgi:MFS transporter, DHA1 family, multidrug resistance protein